MDNRKLYIKFLIKSNNTNKDPNTADRFGIYLGYKTDANGMFVGYDNGGWFWQKYHDGDGRAILLSYQGSLNRGKFVVN